MATNNTNKESQDSSMVEDESVKSNTDCVYFLASPLTCKKGSECEYRHSEYARMNPRDCFYWLNGNCLNPKCSFRHPPLEGFVGPQTGNFAGPPTLVAPAAPVPAAPQNPTKQGVPCIFFQKGYCLKGDRCPFVHNSNPASTKAQLQVPAISATPAAAPAFKKAFGSLEKCIQAKGNSNVNAPKGVEAPAQAKVVPKVQSAQPTNGQPVGRGYQPPSVATKVSINKNSSADNGNLKSRTGSAHQGGLSEDLSFQNGRDADDSLRESSPGFDVLVDDELSDDERYHNEDQYPRMRGHEGRNLMKFDLAHRDDYDSVGDVDREIYHNQRGYDSFDLVPEKYAWDHRGASSERSRVEPAHYDRRGSYNKSQSPDFNQNSDLRQRLSLKQRRGNGLKSVVNPDYDDHVEGRSYRSTGRDSRRSPIREASRGHRLQGRIKLPRSSPVSGNDMYSERENERGRIRGRSSPTRQQVSSQQSRIQDRLSGRNLEENREGRRVNGPTMRNNSFPDNGLDFAGPKRLSELKSTKQTDSRQHQVKSQQSVTGAKLRDAVLATSTGIDGDLSFEGPKPLSEILKRKRTDPTSNTISENKEKIKQHENDVKLASSDSPPAIDAGKQVNISSAVEQDVTAEVVNNPASFESDEDGEISNKKIKLNGEEESSLLNDEDKNKDSEVGEVEVAADGEEQEFDDEYDQGGGEYEYENEDGEGYNLNEVETGEQELDSMDDEDDGDDFAKTLGVSF